MTDNHLSFRENLSAYALGALDVEETAALESHLQTCDSCRAELADVQRVGTGLLSALPPQAPRAALRRSLANRLPDARRSYRPHWQLGWLFNRFAAASAIVLLLGMNLFSLFQVRSLQTQQAELARRLEMDQAALAMIALPNGQALPVSGDGITGSLIVNGEKNSAVLIISDLPVLEQGKTYQIWLIQPDNGRVSAGLFNADRADRITIASLDSSHSFQPYVGIGITVEPAGGSEQPTGPRVFGVEF